MRTEEENRRLLDTLNFLALKNMLKKSKEVQELIDDNLINLMKKRGAKPEDVGWSESFAWLA